MPIFPSPARPADLLGTPTAPRAPTIADLLARRSPAAVTTQQDATRQQMNERLANTDFNIAGTPAEQFNDAAGEVVNFFVSRGQEKEARAADQAATEQAAAQQRGMAETLAGLGIDPKLAVDLATGDPQSNALAMAMLGRKDDQAATEQARLDQQRRDEIAAQRHQEGMDLRKQQFAAGRADAVTSNALRKSALDLTMQDRELAQRQDLAQQGHLEALIADKSPEEQALALADPPGYIESRINAAGGGEMTAAMQLRLQKINDAMQLQDLSRPEATALVDSQTKVITNPVDGKSMLVNTASGDISNIEAPKKPLEFLGSGADGADGVTLEEMSAQTGLRPAIEDFLARTVGQLDPSVVNTEKARAATAFKGLKNQLRTALANNPRPSMWQLQQIDEILPGEGIMESPARAIEVLRQGKFMLEQQHDANIRQMRTGDLTSEIEKDFRAKNAELRTVYESMPTEETLTAFEQQLQTPPAAQQQAPQIDIDTVDPAQLTPDQINSLSAAEIEQLLSKMPP